MITIEKEICKALAISSDSYNEMMYEHGCDYLADRKRNLIKDSNCREDQAEKFTNIFLHSRIWWNWWRREWQIVDRIFLRMHRRRLGDYELLQKGRAKIPSPGEVDLIIDNHVIIKDLSKAALVLTENKMPQNDDTKSIFYT